MIEAHRLLYHSTLGLRVMNKCWSVQVRLRLTHLAPISALQQWILRFGVRGLQHHIAQGPCSPSKPAGGLLHHSASGAGTF